MHGFIGYFTKSTDGVIGQNRWQRQLQLIEAALVDKVEVLMSRRQQNVVFAFLTKRVDR